MKLVNSKPDKKPNSRLLALEWLIAIDIRKMEDELLCLLYNNIVILFFFIFLLTNAQNRFELVPLFNGISTFVGHLTTNLPL